MNAAKDCPSVKTFIMVNGVREGWHDFNNEYCLFTGRFDRPEDCSCGDDTALMFFTSGTTGNPKMAAHKHTYGLGHFVTAKYWHCCQRDGLHLTISDTGWGKSLWGKIPDNHLLRAPDNAQNDDKGGSFKVRPFLDKAYDHRRRST